MPADTRETSDGDLGAEQPAAAAAPRGFAQLARRISAWTTNSLLTIIILLAGLGFGRQVLRWWAADSHGPATATPSIGGSETIGDPSQPHLLHFGDQPWALRRQALAGDRQAATIALRRATRQAIESAASPSKPPSAAESRLLASLDRWKPVDESPGKWRLYELPQGFPLVVGVQDISENARDTSGATAGLSSSAEAAPSPPRGKAAPKRSRESKLASPPRRVVVWGLAIPMASQAWTLYTFQPEQTESHQNSRLPEISLPPKANRLLAVQVGDCGGAVIAFSGSAGLEAWKRFYDDWFAGQGWKAAAPWRCVGASWHRHYATAGSRQPASAEIRLGPDGRGQNTGVVMTSALKEQTP